MSTVENKIPTSIDPAFGLLRHRKVVLVVDLVESVSLMQADELGVITRWQAFLAHVSQVILPNYKGRLVKSLGDGLMLEFDCAPPGIAAATAMHQWMQDQFSPDTPLRLRAGLHATDVYADAHDIYGAGVNLAALIATLASPGETVATTQIMDGITIGLDCAVEDLGDCYLRKLKEPIRAWRIKSTSHQSSTFQYSEHAPSLQPVIGILPFAARNYSRENSATGELIADALISQLSSNKNFKLISRLSSSAFSGRSLTTREIAKSLSADFIVSGSYFLEGARLQITAELIDGKDDLILWTDRVNGEITELLEAQGHFINEIANAVQSEIGHREMLQVRTRPLPTLASCSLMFGAMSLTHSMLRTDFFKAQDILLHLLDRHRRHPMILTWLAKWYVLQVEQSWTDDKSAASRIALDHSSRALDLDPQSALALTIDGFVRCNLHQDFATAAARYEAAIDKNRSEPLAWLFMGMLHAFHGNALPALEACAQARSLSPFDPARFFYDSLTASIYLTAGRYEEAIDFAQRSLQANKSHISTHRALTISLVMAERQHEARASATQLLKLDPRLTVSGYLARSPGVRVGPGRRFAEALRAAGIPE